MNRGQKNSGKYFCGDFIFLIPPFLLLKGSKHTTYCQYFSPNYLVLREFILLALQEELGGLRRRYRWLRSSA